MCYKAEGRHPMIPRRSICELRVCRIGNSHSHCIRSANPKRPLYFDIR